MVMVKKLLAIATCTGLVCAAPANALIPVEGRVTTLQPSSLPAVVHFQMDSGFTDCPALTWLTWANSNTDNNLAVYGTLMAALVSGKRIRVYFVEGAPNCVAVQLHLLSD